MWIFIALFTTAVLLFVLNRKQRYTYFERLGIPGPKPSFFLGNLGQMRTLGAFESEKYWKKKFGKVYGIFFGPSPTLIVSDEEMLREILVKQCENFYDRPSSKCYFFRTSMYVWTNSSVREQTPVIVISLFV